MNRHRIILCWIGIGLLVCLIIIYMLAAVIGLGAKSSQFQCAICILLCASGIYVIACAVFVIVNFCRGGNGWGRFAFLGGIVLLLSLPLLQAYLSLQRDIEAVLKYNQAKKEAGSKQE